MIVDVHPGSVLFPSRILGSKKQCCGSGMLIFNQSGSRISDPKTATKERGGKKFVVKPFFVTINFTKMKIILFFKYSKKKFGPVFKEL
jgi:hypothetical protein